MDKEMPVLLEKVRPPFLVSNDPAKLDLEVIHGFLSSSYWSPGIPLAVLQRAIAGSLCFGLYHHGSQIGFARIVTDHATFAYLCDVFVLEEYRGRGLGHWLIQTLTEHPDLQSLRRMVLVTRDAHGLYEKFGFSPLVRPEGYMELHRPNVYEAQRLPE